ncbi:MAG TPA: periplasmic heavy metal sensor [Paracoccaceae bacterium]|nr:periplasmic heavy metal sensor [Paracoccaceae bacterium]
MSAESGTARSAVGGRPAGCPGWMKLLLILSLAANLAVAGVIIGHSVRGGDEERRGPGRVIDWIVGMVPEERRAFAREQFAGVPDRVEAARAERITHLPAVVAAMQAEPFDPAALDAALDTMFSRQNSGRTILRERLIALLGELAPAERAAFAEHFRERLESRDERGDD